MLNPVLRKAEWLVGDKSVGMWKAALVTYFETIFRNCLKELKQEGKNPCAGQHQNWPLPQVKRKDYLFSHLAC